MGIKPTTKTTCTGVEMFRKLLDEGEAGDNVGIFFAARSVKTLNAARFSKPGTITPHTHFKGEVYVLTKEEGGRHTPFFKGLSSAVLLPYDGRDGHDRAAGRRRNGHAWRQHQMTVAHLPDRHGTGSSFRHP